MITNEEFDGMEQQLLALGRAMPYPQTPDLAAGFWRRLDSERRAAAPPALSYAGLALAAAVVVLSVVIGVVAPVRDAAADLFDRINIFETDQPTEGLPTDISGLDTTLQQAEFALGERIILPTYPEGIEPTRVLLQDFGSAKTVVLLYDPIDGPEFAYFVSNTNVGKGIPRGSDGAAEPVGGFPGEAFWLKGERIVQYYDSKGNVITDSVRVTSAYTLVWDQNGKVYRIEGTLPRDEAIRIAQSVIAAEAGE